MDTTRPRSARTSGLRVRVSPPTGVQHDVHPAQRADLQRVVTGREVDRGVGAQPGDELVVLGPRGGHHLGSQCAGDLDGDRADPTRSTVHQDPLPGPHPGAFDQGFPHRHAHQRETGSLDVRQLCGLAGHQSLVDHVELGIGPLPGEHRRQVPDFVARLEVVRPGAGPDHHAGHVVADHRGQRRPGRGSRRAGSADRGGSRTWPSHAPAPGPAPEWPRQLPGGERGVRATEADEFHHTHRRSHATTVD